MLHSALNDAEPIFLRSGWLTVVLAVPNLFRFFPRPFLVSAGPSSNLFPFFSPPSFGTRWGNAAQGRVKNSLLSLPALFLIGGWEGWCAGPRVRTSVLFWHILFFSTVLGAWRAGPNQSFSLIVEHHVAKFWVWIAQPLLFGIVGTAVDFRKIKAATIPRSIVVILSGNPTASTDALTSSESPFLPPKHISVAVAMRVMKSTCVWTPGEVLGRCENPNNQVSMHVSSSPLETPAPLQVSTLVLIFFSFSTPAIACPAPSVEERQETPTVSIPWLDMPRDLSPPVEACLKPRHFNQHFLLSFFSPLFFFIVIFNSQKNVGNLPSHPSHLRQHGRQSLSEPPRVAERQDGPVPTHRWPRPDRSSLQ